MAVGPGLTETSVYMYSTQMLGKNFHIKPEKAFKKSILDGKEQNQAQLLGTSIVLSGLCLLEISRGLTPIGEARH